jgi:hypothetical protein
VDWFLLGGPIFGASTKINIAYYEALTSMAKMSRALAVDDTYTKIKRKYPLTSLEPGQKHHENERYFTAFTPPEPAALPLVFQSLPGWDSAQIVSPYASGFTAEAHFLNDDAASACTIIKLVWGIMADSSSENYSGARWEAMKADGTPFGHDTSLAHEWSTWPVFLYVGGVRALEAGWVRRRVRPMMCGLEEVDICVEMVRVRVEVSVRVEVGFGRGEIKVRVRLGTTCEASLPKGWRFDSKEDVCHESKVIVVEGQDAKVFFNLIVN